MKKTLRVETPDGTARIFFLRVSYVTVPDAPARSRTLPKPNKLSANLVNLFSSFFVDFFLFRDVSVTTNSSVRRANGRNLHIKTHFAMSS